MLYYLLEYLHQNYHLPGTGLYKYISFRAGAAVIVSLFIALIFGKKIILFLKQKQLGEQVRDLGLEGQKEKEGTPTMGGIIIILATIIPVLLFAKLDNIYVILLLSATIWMGFIGFLDDYIKVFKKNKKGLKGLFKVIGQLGLGLMVGSVLYFNDGVTVRQKNYHSNEKFPFHAPEHRAITSLPFYKDNVVDYSELLFFTDEETAQKYTWLVFIGMVMLIVTAVSNGANLTDGIDGLAAGSSIIIVATLSLIAWLSGNIIFSNYLNILFIPNSGEVSIFAAAFIGGMIGFLWYNTYPAQVFMGDTGSLTLGGLIAVLAIIVRKELLLPVLCGIFLVENLSVVLQVLYFKYTKRKYGEGRRIFLMAPLHHHYQKKGYHESKIVARFLIVGFILAVICIISLKLQ